MVAETLNYRFVTKRDTAANFVSADTLLLSGEWALETDTRKLKIGDGSTSWNDLPYATQRNGSVSAEWTSGAVVTACTVHLVYSAPSDGTIKSVDYLTSIGSFTASIQINGVVVSNLSSIAVSSSTATNKVAGSNSFAKGDMITLVITSPVNAPTNSLINLNLLFLS